MVTQPVCYSAEPDRANPGLDPSSRVWRSETLQNSRRTFTREPQQDGSRAVQSLVAALPPITTHL